MWLLLPLFVVCVACYVVFLISVVCVLCIRILFLGGVDWLLCVVNVVFGVFVLVCP